MNIDTSWIIRIIVMTLHWSPDTEVPCQLPRVGLTVVSQLVAISGASSPPSKYSLNQLLIKMSLLINQQDKVFEATPVWQNIELVTCPLCWSQHEQSYNSSSAHGELHTSVQLYSQPLMIITLLSSFLKLDSVFTCVPKFLSPSQGRSVPFIPSHL